ncbi:MAG TPA: protein-disulfide reductase DsbD domain-containing protein [Candidatus Acidoferrales bacterium]|nr:protein-disulfide reductase DsbD domain-containing protein [Candidatus Acidoferrales bacterium]
MRRPGSRCIKLGLAIALASSFALNTRAQSPAQSEAEAKVSHAKVELIAEQSTIPPGAPVWVGLHFQLDSGWHVYWQYAGDSGEPPKVQWTLPPGFKAGPIRWPTPERLGSGSIIDYGYEGQVLLMAPIEGPVASESRPLPNVSADVKYVVCREICVQGKAHLALSPPSPSDSAAQRALFTQTRAALPKPLPAAWQVHATSDKDYFYLHVQTGSREQAVSFFPIVPGDIENSAPQKFESSADGFRLTLKKSDQMTAPVHSLKGLLVLGDGKAYEIAARVPI